MSALGVVRSGPPVGCWQVCGQRKLCTLDLAPLIVRSGPPSPLDRPPQHPIYLAPPKPVRFSCSTPYKFLLVAEAANSGDKSKLLIALNARATEAGLAEPI